jgi:hypothetical protein
MAANGIDIGGFRQSFDVLANQRGSALKERRVFGVVGVARGTQKRVASIVKLSGDEGSGQRGTRIGPVGTAELLAAEQEIAGSRRVDASYDPAWIGKKRQADPLLVAEFHRAGADHACAEKGDGIEVMDRNRRANLLLNLDDRVEMIAP